MTYVYDLILNFNERLYDFYEWDKQDSIIHVKKIGLLKISSLDYNNIIDNEIKFNNDLLYDIYNRTEIYENKKIKLLPYAALLTDGYRVMAIILNNEGYITKYSLLLLDEEEDVLEISIRLPIVKLAYDIVKLKIHNNLTRHEEEIIQYIRKDLQNSYKNNQLNKLKYFYYEYFNEESNDIEWIYNRLINILREEVNDKHYNLYNLIKLSYSRKAT